MKLSLLLLALIGVTTQAAGQVREVATMKAPPPTLSLRFAPTKGIDRTLRFANGMVVSLLDPEVTVFDGSTATHVALAKLGPQREKRLAVANDKVILRHKINALDYFDYVLDQHDSVLVSYAKAGPVITVANRQSLPYDYAFEGYCRARFVKDKYSPLSVFANPDFFHDFRHPVKANETVAAAMQRILQTNLAIRTNIYEKAARLLRAENALLDSLKSRGQLSEAPYWFYKDRVKNQQYILDIETGRLTSDQLRPLLAAATQQAPGQPTLYHHKLLEAAADKYLTEKAPLLNLKDGVNRDYRQVYASLSASTIFPTRDKDYLLAREVKRIEGAFSQADLLAHLRKFEQEATDTTLVNAVKAQYALDFDKSRTATKSVVLLDAQGARLTFDDLLRRHKGKVVYVDFWASWCVPCREALPHSLKLRNALKDQPIVFVYLSIDKAPAPWRAATDQENLTAYRENYLVVNYQTADFMRQQKLTSIPRYMVFDKTGKLVYATAPGAESERTTSLLTGLAK